MSNLNRIELGADCDATLRARVAAFGPPLGQSLECRGFYAECIDFDRENVTFRPRDSGEEFTLPTSVFAYIPCVGAVTYIDRVHHRVLIHIPDSPSIVDGISGFSRERT